MIGRRSSGWLAAIGSGRCSIMGYADAESSGFQVGRAPTGKSTIGERLPPPYFQNAQVEIATAFDDHRVPFILLKGEALSNALYPEDGRRPYDDIDLLVRSVIVAMRCTTLLALRQRSWRPPSRQRSSVACSLPRWPLPSCQPVGCFSDAFWFLRCWNDTSSSSSSIRRRHGGGHYEPGSILGSLGCKSDHSAAWHDGGKMLRISSSRVAIPPG